MKKHIIIILSLLFPFLYLKAQCPILEPANYYQWNQNDEITHTTDFDLFDTLKYWDDGEKYFAIFSSGLRIGGKKPNEDLVYAQVSFIDDDFAPGPLSDLDGQVSSNDCINWNQFFIVKKEEIDLFKQDYLDNGTIDNPIPDAIKYYPCNGNNLFFENYGFDLPINNMGGLAPFKDQNGDGIYQASLGDYPLIDGEEQSFYIQNDRSLQSETPAGMEFLVQASYDIPTVENVISSRVKIKAIYHGEDELNDFFLSYWLDGDLQCWSKNNIGCIPEENLFFYYMREDWSCVENESNGKLPLLLVKIEEGAKKQMSSFISASRPVTTSLPKAVESPITPEENYNFMQAIWIDGTPLTASGFGYDPNSTDLYPYQFDHSGNAPNGAWKECELDFELRDAQTFTNFGPYNLSKGDMIDLNITIYLVKDTGISCPDASDIMDIYNTVSQGVYLNQSLTPISNIEVFPSPANDFIHVESNDNAFSKVRIFNITGKAIIDFDMKPSNRVRIDVSGLQPGLYILNTFDDKQNLTSQSKILKL